MYPNATEDLLSNDPEPCGNAVQIKSFVDSDPSCDKVTRQYKH